MLFRGGRREALLEGAVVPLEAEGDGVEAGGEEEDVVGAPDGSGVSLNDILQCAQQGFEQDHGATVKIIRRFAGDNSLRLFRYIKCRLFNSSPMRDDPADKWRGVGVAK